MSANRDVTGIVRSWLREDGPEDADRVLDLVLDQLDTTPQRRATWWPARRPLTMSISFRYGIAAVALAVAALLGFTYIRNQVGTTDPTPTPTSVKAPHATRKRRVKLCTCSVPIAASGSVAHGANRRRPSRKRTS